jgi:hypothetical protein
MSHQEVVKSRKKMGRPASEKLERIDPWSARAKRSLNREACGGDRP